MTRAKVPMGDLLDLQTLNQTRWWEGAACHGADFDIFAPPTRNVPQNAAREPSRRRRLVRWLPRGRRVPA